MLLVSHALLLLPRGLDWCSLWHSSASTRL
jgi:hypothetical protein